MERWRKLKNNENENMWVSCQFGIDKSKFKSTENTRQSIIQMFPKGNICTLHPKED